MARLSSVVEEFERVKDLSLWPGAKNRVTVFPGRRTVEFDGAIHMEGVRHVVKRAGDAPLEVAFGRPMVCKLTELVRRKDFVCVPGERAEPR